MEIGETLSKLFKKESDREFEEEAFSRVTDVWSSSKPVITHTTGIGELFEILREGLISSEFGRRIQKKGYEDVEEVYLYEMPLHRAIWFRVGPQIRHAGRTRKLVGVMAYPNGPIFTSDNKPIQDLSTVHAYGNVIVKTRIEWHQES